MKKIISVMLAVAMILCFAAVTGAEDVKQATLVTASPQSAVASQGASLSFDNISSEVLKNNLNCLIIQENINLLEGMDYDELSDDLRDQLNSLADMEWALMSVQNTPYADSYSLDQVSSAYDGLRDQFDDIKSGKMQEDNANMVRSLKTTQKQVVVAAESLFMASKGLDVTYEGLERQLAALERTKAEMQVRKGAGQVSEQNLAEVESGIAQLESGMATLDMNREVIKLQLKNLLGRDLDGELTLKEPSVPTAAQISAMNLTEDLALAKANSYELFSAKETLDDAEESYKDTRDDLGWNSEKLEAKQNNANWQTAQYTYQNTVAGFELNFRTLYAQVKDYYQVYLAKQEAVDSALLALKAAQIKYNYGTGSKNQMLTAEDDYETALDAVTSAGYDLKSSYVTYMHAVNDGILN